ncbi:calcium-activated potassium channel alpha chain [Anaeramoeba flamelloides]|uniref:Calcium-activated potassium channel alpha chain n=1 Tax=Anaeramoeba flamelloides TaxID=1746091 RepID=A0AAV7Z4T6_9EUKA|nr:calcium-activated potassium channel alpha chain [Anaeramoeba flamelloides]
MLLNGTQVKKNTTMIYFQQKYIQSKLYIRHKLRLETKSGTIFELVQNFTTIFSIVMLILEQYYDHSTLSTAIEIAISMVFLLDYFLRWYSSDNKLEHYLNKWSIIDFFSILPIFISLFISESESKAIRTLRVLRIFRIFNCYRLLQYSSSIIKRQIYKILITLLTIILTGAIIIFTIETMNATDEQLLQIKTLHDALYFFVITLSTVGYGDMVPKTTLGRLFILFTVLIFILVLPVQLNELLSLLSEREKLVGQLYKKRKDIKHIVVTGYYTNSGLLAFLKEFFVNCTVLDKYLVVILSPCKPNYELLNSLKHPFFENKIKIMVGTPLNDNDLERSAIDSSEACFFFCDKQTTQISKSELFGIMSLFSINDHGHNNNNIFVQTIRPLNRLQLKTVGYREILFCNNLRFKLLALNTFIPGFSTLILNLTVSQYSFYSLISKNSHLLRPNWNNNLLHLNKNNNKKNYERKNSQLDDWLIEYLYGSCNLFHVCNVSKDFIGSSFSSLSLLMYSQFEILIIGVLIFHKRKKQLIIFNPGSNFILKKDHVLIIIATKKKYNDFLRTLSYGLIPNFEIIRKEINIDGQAYGPGDNEEFDYDVNKTFLKYNNSIINNQEIITNLIKHRQFLESLKYLKKDSKNQNNEQEENDDEDDDDDEDDNDDESGGGDGDDNSTSEDANYGDDDVDDVVGYTNTKVNNNKKNININGAKKKKKTKRKRKRKKKKKRKTKTKTKTKTGKKGRNEKKKTDNMEGNKTDNRFKEIKKTIIKKNKELKAKKLKNTKKNNQSDLMRYLTGGKISSVSKKIDLTYTQNKVNFNIDYTTEEEMDFIPKKKTKNNKIANYKLRNYKSLLKEKSFSFNSTVPKSIPQIDQIIKVDSILEKKHEKIYYVNTYLSSLKDSTLINCKHLTGHIIISGQITGIEIFVRKLRKKTWKMIVPIVILASSVTTQQWNPISLFPKVYYLCGNIKNSYDLIRLNIKKCSRIIVLPQEKMNMNKNPFSQNNQNQKAKSNIFFGADTIFALKSLEKIKQHPPFIITEIYNPNSLKFLTTNKRINKKEMINNNNNNKNKNNYNYGDVNEKQNLEKIQKKIQLNAIKQKNVQKIFKRIHRIVETSTILPEIHYLKSDEYLTNSYYASGWAVLSTFSDFLFASSYWKPFITKIIFQFISMKKCKIPNENFSTIWPSSSSSSTRHSYTNNSLSGSGSGSESKSEPEHKSEYSHSMDSTTSFQSNHQNKNENKSKNENEIQQCFLYIMKLPNGFKGKKYLTLFKYLSENFDVIPIGIYRFGLKNINPSPLPYVFTNPPPFTLLEKEDRIYILAEDINIIQKIHNSRKPNQQNLNISDFDNKRFSLNRGKEYQASKNGMKSGEKKGGIYPSSTHSSFSLDGNSIPLDTFEKGNNHKN